MNKAWSCNNQCKANCCDYMYLDVTEEDIVSIGETNSFIVHKNRFDSKWVGFHEGITIEKLPEEKIRIMIDPMLKPKVQEHPYLKKKFIYLKTKCSKLLPSGRCKIYRNRPQICRNAPCIWSNPNPILHWFGKPIRGEE